MIAYLNNRNKMFAAVDEYNPKTNEMKGYKNSFLNDEIKKNRETKSIIEKRNIYFKNNILLEDVTFNCSSTAGNFVTGRSTNGWNVWKDENGLSPKDIIKND